MKEDTKNEDYGWQRTVEIRMVVWQETNWSPDMSQDILEACGLKRDDNDAYILLDVPPRLGVK